MSLWLEIELTSHAHTCYIILKTLSERVYLIYDKIRMIQVLRTLLLGNRETWQASIMPANDSGCDLASWHVAVQAFWKVENAQWEQNPDKNV